MRDPTLRLIVAQKRDPGGAVHRKFVLREYSAKSRTPGLYALRGNRTPGGSMATTQVTTTPLMLGYRKNILHHIDLRPASNDLVNGRGLSM